MPLINRFMIYYWNINCVYMYIREAQNCRDKKT